MVDPTVALLEISWAAMMVEMTVEKTAAWMVGKWVVKMAVLKVYM